MSVKIGKKVLIIVILFRIASLLILATLSAMLNPLISVFLIIFSFVYFISLFGILAGSRIGGYLLIVLSLANIIFSLFTFSLLGLVLNIVILVLAIGQTLYPSTY